MTEPVFFQPSDGWVGDVIPTQRDGEFLLYYLFDARAQPKGGMPWRLVSTRDFVTFEDRGTGLPNGGEDDEDFNAYTGSIVTDPTGLQHVYYTGQNPRRLGADGRPLQLVCHATSLDGVAWTKHPEDTVGASAGYETGDWRDPFVFFDEGVGLWRMLVAARHEHGPERRRGVIAQLTSTDLVTWSPAGPFWDPRRYITHECPDVFQWGEWWYLVYSEFSEGFTTRYRMARSPEGPWRVPERDSVDGRAFYASKSVERDGRRFFVGWIASKAGGTDDGAWQWAGTMSALEAHQSPDGTLDFGLPAELVASFDGEPVRALASQELSAPDGYAVALTDAAVPARFHARLAIDIAPGTRETGLLLRASDDGDESYILRLEPARGRLVFDRWPRRRHGGEQWEISGDVPFAIELERPCALEPGRHDLEVLVDGDLLVAVVDGRVALSARMYDRVSGRLGVFAGEGTVVLQHLDIRSRTDTARIAAHQPLSMEMERQ
ncbi:glycoside hydrolase family 32 protein [Galbitalea sp. SE-J8]|uniref:glycoside hydrolase family 32 protein n=1 Tax=Galbitalea sp. SE-J8 TaxID=3054952 RepID=UPI00259D037D|nr:glycoside hydrolase family 32 protein [Galbitalea sp. SE-J8]MDM4763670.1 glycoside hydrolase family 32 protein [Galbitalea sp. SE-J8]